jgi:hypothetical protein
MVQVRLCLALMLATATPNRSVRFQAISRAYLFQTILSPLAPQLIRINQKNRTILNLEVHHIF